MGVGSLTLLALIPVLLSAALLFLVQPLAGRVLLPVLGGSPAVWSTCMVFFQAALLLGYLYAHGVGTRVPAKRQWLVHAGVLAAASLVLPLPIDVGEPGGADPRWWVLRTLTLTVGLPFFALAATAPLVQRWYSRTSEPGANDPYFLYAASNAGSMLGLLGSLALEPVAARSTLIAAWAMAFWGAALLVTVCGYVTARRAHPVPTGRTVLAPADVSWTARIWWIVLALVPSALLVGVTQHLATDVVSAPLLWVVPLALYLGTCIVAFSRTSRGAAMWRPLAPVVALLILGLALAEVRYPILPVAIVHLVAFTVLSLACHTRLAIGRPDPAELTAYFVCVSLGGVLGGCAAALIAPAVFSSVFEYPLAIAAAVLLVSERSAERARTRGRPAWLVATAILAIAGYWSVAAFDRASGAPHTARGQMTSWLGSLTGDAEVASRLMRASFAVPAVLLWCVPGMALPSAGLTAGLLMAGSTVRTGGEVLARERTFFGVHQVTSIQEGAWHVLTHGTTTHGVQAVRGKVHPLPTAYYHPAGPIGDVVFTLVPGGRFRDVAVIGLGAGALAAYAGKDVRMDFFEIDDAVIRIASDSRYFTYLTDAKTRPGVNLRTVAVDGRIGLRAMPAASYDLLVIDAFSSDAIPTHLVTREAIALYESRLKARGLVAFHVSSRFFDLPPVLATIAADRGLVAYARHDLVVPPERLGEGMRPSVWVVLARQDADLGQLAGVAPRWMRLVVDPGVRLWTDDYSNVLGALQ